MGDAPKLLTSTQQRNLERLLEARYERALSDLGVHVQRYRSERYLSRGQGSEAIRALYVAADAKVEQEFAAKYPKLADVQKKIEAWAKRTNASMEKIREDAAQDGLTVQYFSVSGPTVGEAEMRNAKAKAREEVEVKIGEAIDKIGKAYETGREKILLATLTEVADIDTFFAFPSTEDLLS